MQNLNKVSLSPNKRPLGNLVETRVAEYLQKEGFLLLQRNFSCRLGEIDLIGTHQECLVFVEVRFRRHNRYGSAAESVSFYKQQKVKRCARFFLATRPQWSNAACRFDVVAVTLQQNQPQIDWIPNAFC